MPPREKPDMVEEIEDILEESAENYEIARGILEDWLEQAKKLASTTSRHTFRRDTLQAIDKLTNELIELERQAYASKFGAQSANQGLLRKHRRNLSQQEYIKAAENVVNMFYQRGYISEAIFNSKEFQELHEQRMRHRFVPRPRKEEPKKEEPDAAKSDMADRDSEEGKGS
jgi:hypothetical protein